MPFDAPGTPSYLGDCNVEIAGISIGLDGVSLSSGKKAGPELLPADYS